MAFKWKKSEIKTPIRVRRLLQEKKPRTDKQAMNKAVSILHRIINKIQRESNYLRDGSIIENYWNQIKKEFPLTEQSPVIFMNSSSRLEGLSQNAAFTVLSALAVRARGVPVIHFVCSAGMSRCMLGTQWQQPFQSPPCGICYRQSRRMYEKGCIRNYHYYQDQFLARMIEKKSLAELEECEYQDLPLGKLTLPSLRWAMRAHHLDDTPDVRFLLREFILSAWSIASQFLAIVDGVKPRSVVVFNGQTFPEATVKYIAKKKGIRVVTHEVAVRPLSAFFSSGEATAYPINIPDDFQLNIVQNSKLDQYLSQRFKGNFTMAGIRFWPNMRQMDQSLSEKILQFKAVVPIFTNVVFDTSQVHANTIFDTMFDWLDSLIPVFKEYPEICFVIRAHPDECRTGKESRESVAQWVAKNKIAEWPNVVFIQSAESISSYELIQRSKFIMIYNSTIGLEAAILGKSVLAAGRSRFTQMPIVHFPPGSLEYEKMLHVMLSSPKIEQSEMHGMNARRFFYYQFFRTSLLLDRYIFPDKQQHGFVHFRKSDHFTMTDTEDRVLRIIAEGILDDKPFEMPEEIEKIGDIMRVNGLLDERKYGRKKRSET